MFGDVPSHPLRVGSGSEANCALLTGLRSSSEPLHVESGASIAILRAPRHRAGKESVASHGMLKLNCLLYIRGCENSGGK